MKINDNQGSTFVKKFVTGPTVFTNILVNPTMKEAQDYGLGYITEEPNYLSKTEEGTPRIDIVVYGKVVDNPDIIVSNKYAITAENMLSSTGKTCYLRYNGITSWADSEEDLPDWFKQGEYRKALRGEEAFYDFFLAFNNTNFNDLTVFEISKDDYKKMFSGDFSELKLVNNLPDFKWQWICYIDEYNDKLYNKIYRNKSFKHWETTPYLYNSIDKVGSKVEWSKYIDFIVNVDVNNRFNPIYISNNCEIYTLDEIKAKLESGEEVTKPVFNESKKSDNLPF